MISFRYSRFPGEVIIKGLPAFIKWNMKMPKVMFHKTLDPVTEIIPNGFITNTKDKTHPIKWIGVPY